MIITRRMKVFVFILLLFLPSISKGQSPIDVETEKFPGVHKLTTESFNDCCAMKKGYRAVFYFDSIGNAVKSSYFFKKKRLASYEYKYNDKGLLIEEIKTYDSWKKGSLTTIFFFYELDSNDRVICKTNNHGMWKSTLYYQDFDSNNNPQTVVHKIDNVIWTKKQEFNSLNKPILIQTLASYTFECFEIICSERGLIF